jgi:DNA-binding MarR family transcriptional regulator
MRKNSTGRQPRPDEIKEVASQIDTTEFWKYVRFGDTINRYIEITMKKDNVSPLQSVAMYSLVLEGGTITPTHLSRMMFRSKHSMTKIIDNLEKEGLVIRDYTDKDRRVTHVKITSAGLEYVRQNFSKGNERAQKVMDCLDISQRKSLVNLTETMRKKLTELIDSL